eukprot:8760117-Pyramimonas_sp.AAC.1
MDALEFAKRLWATLIEDDVNVNVDESTRYAGESALVIDAKALYDAAKKDRTTSFQDKRTGTEVLARRERVEATQTQWKWASSERQYADALTKLATAALHRQTSSRTTSATAGLHLYGSQEED